MNVNIAIICGRITRDIEMKTTTSGNSVASFGIVTNRTWTQDGIKKEEAEFHNVVAFGKIAETIAQYSKKGDELFYSRTQ